MSNLNTFVDKVKSVIDNNAELKNSVVLSKVLESVRYTGDDIQFLTDLKESLTDVNKFLGNSELRNIISSIDMKLNESNNTDSAVLKNLSNEFDAVTILEHVAKSDEYNNPSLHSTLNKLLEEAKSTQYSYLMINPIKESLSGYTEYNCVKWAIDICDAYLNENKSKLVVLDAANYLSASNLNKKTVGILTESLRTNNFNPDSLTMKLGDAGSKLCANVLESLRQIRQEETKGFDLGQGKSNVSVSEYVGPVLVENADVTFNVNGKFIRITPNVMEQANVSKVIDNKSGIHVYELNEEFVKANCNKYYNTQKAFESLGFHLDKNASFAKLNRSSVGFKLNESFDIDIMYNGKVSSLDEIKRDGTQMFESSDTKAMLYGLLENTDMIGHMKFVKFLMNENAASMVINLGENYYVYDYTNEGKVNTYKFDAYKLYEFCRDKFNYDMSSTFGVALNNTQAKYNKIAEGKKETLAALDDLNESLTKLDNALAGKLDESDRQMLNTLRKSFVSKIDEMKQTYQNLCVSEDKLLSLDSCLIKEDLSQDENGDETSDGDGASTQPEENTTDEQDTAVEEGGAQADTDDSGDDAGSDAEQVDESKINECGDGLKQIIVTFEDGSESTETVDSELPDEELAKIYAPGNVIDGKTVVGYEECPNGCCGEPTEDGVVEDVNEGLISVPEWSVSALVDNDFRGLTADKYNEALQYKEFLASSGVKTLVVDESRETEILDKNSMNENREECVYLKYTLNEGLFKNEIYGVETPFAKITNLGLFKDGRFKKACNEFLEKSAPIVYKKCKFALLQGLSKLKSEGDDKVDDFGKQVIDVLKKYDANSLDQEIKNADEQLKNYDSEITALMNKYIASRKSLAPAFKYDLALTKSKLSDMKGKILEAFRTGVKPADLKDDEMNDDTWDKMKQSETVKTLTQKTLDSLKTENDKMKQEIEKMKSEAEEVSKGGDGDNAEGGNSENGKIKAKDVNGNEVEVEVKSGLVLKNDNEGQAQNGSEFKLGEMSGDGKQFKVLYKEGDEVKTSDTPIDTSKVKEQLASGGYKVVKPAEESNNSEQKPAEGENNAPAQGEQQNA